MVRNPQRDIGSKLFGNILQHYGLWLIALFSSIIFSVNIREYSCIREHLERTTYSIMYNLFFF